MDAGGARQHITQVSEPSSLSALTPRLPSATGRRERWTSLYGSSRGLAIASAATAHSGPLMVVAPDADAARRLEDEIRFFLGDAVGDMPLINFPDWETLPYDVFSPHQDIISERCYNGRYLFRFLSSASRWQPESWIFPRRLHLLLLASLERPRYSSGTASCEMRSQ